MKLSLHSNKLIAVFLVTAIILSCNCHHSLSTSLTTSSSAEIIKITGATIATGWLELKDKNNDSATIFVVDAGKTIEWIVDPKIIQRITNIYQKPGSLVNVFSSLPDSLSTYGNWQGSIDSTASGKTEDYNIDWIDLNGDPHTYDPKIQVR